MRIVLDIETLRDLAKLLGTDDELLASTLKRVGSLSRELTITDLDRPFKQPRIVHAPQGPLRALQSRLLRNVLLPRFDRSANSYGGVPGRNQVGCARQHLRQKFVYSGDIRNFYPSIHFERVRRLFRVLGCSDEVANAITRLTTKGHRLAQGFITSPIIADRMFRPADLRITALCEKEGLTYTRFVDDLIISAPFDLEKSGIPKTITEILASTGFPKQKGKDRFGSITGNGVILGLRLNKGRADICPSYHAETVRRLKDAARLGAGGHFDGPYFTRAELYGRLRFVGWVNSNRIAEMTRHWKGLNWAQIHSEAEARNIVARSRRIFTARYMTLATHP